jgi:RNA polymerase sigma-70 factor (ECF subfamily)
MKSLTNLPDQQLIHLFMSGDASALEHLILRHKDKIYTSIFLLVKDKYLAEDIFQDVTPKKVNFYPGPCVLPTTFA